MHFVRRWTGYSQRKANNLILKMSFGGVYRRKEVATSAVRVEE